MKFALVNPNWSFEGSTYFGCAEPHFPLGLLSAREMLRAAGHEVMLVDAWMERCRRRRCASAFKTSEKIFW